jgi:hypothetical protein
MVGKQVAHTYSFTPHPDGTTAIDVDVVREGKNLRAACSRSW